jgi:hypothetical protein
LATQIPQELRVKLMQHFGIAKEYEKNPETISITYYCLMYVANEALKLQTQLPTEKKFISGVIDYLETVCIIEIFKAKDIDSIIFRRKKIIRMMKLSEQCQQVKQRLKN